MVTYCGWRDDKGNCRVRVRDGNISRELPLRLDLSNHSPTGFEWGYGGSGPAQLALAILADALGDDQRALRLYQHFKWEVVANLARDRAWGLDSLLVRQTAFRLERKRAKA